jgi:NAD(P)-dependent dehydrogenase (short-subunit alcohol dehydrogenase family)
VSTVDSGIPTTALNLQDLAFIADPYPALREIQEAGPVVYHEGLGQGGPNAPATAASIDNGFARVTIGRCSLPDEVASMVAFLVSPAGAYVHGTSVSVGGGLSD